MSYLRLRLFIRRFSRDISTVLSISAKASIKLRAGVPKKTGNPLERYSTTSKLLRRTLRRLTPQTQI